MQASCLGTRVGRLQRVVSRRFDRALRPVGLTVAQAELLSALVVAGAPVRPGVLADVLALERSTVSRNLSLLQDRGLVAAAEVSPTGRSLAVAVTSEGERALAGAHRSWASVQDELVAALGPQAASVLDGWLGRLDVAGEGA